MCIPAITSNLTCIYSFTVRSVGTMTCFLLLLLCLLLRNKHRVSMTRARRQRCVAAGVGISGRSLRDEGSDMCTYNNFYLAPQTPNEAFDPSLLQPALAAIAINTRTCSAKINGIPKARNYHMTVSRTHKLSSSIHLNLHVPHRLAIHFDPHSQNARVVRTRLK